MNGSVRVITITLLAMAVTAASAAQLDLPPRAPRPAFDAQDSPFVRLMSRLRSEVRPFDLDGIEAGEASAIAGAVSGTWRLLALVMLERGVHGGPEADQVVLSGMQMAMSRRTLDDLLAEEESPLFEDERLVAFLQLADDALQHDLPLSPAEARDALYEIVAPLRDLLEEHREIGARLWPVAAPSGRPVVPAERGSIAAVRQRMTDLERAAAESGLAERHALRELYAARLSALQPLIASGVSQRIDHESAAERAAFVRSVDRLAEDLARSEAALKALPAVRETAAQRTLRDVLEALEESAPALWPVEETSARRAWRQRMDWFIAAASALPERPNIGPPPRLFAPVARQLERAGRLSERTTLDALERLAAEPDAWTDPGVVSGLRAVDEYRQDVLRLPAMASWPDRVGALDAEAGRRIANWLRQWTEQLADPMRRDQARSRIVQLERELALQDGMTRLLEPADDRATMNLLGGRPEEVREAVRAQQRAWARAWGVGAPDDELTQRLEDCAMLAAVVDDGASVLARSHRASPLALWPGWEMASIVLERLNNELPIRVRLASTQLAMRDFASLRRECRVIERELSVVRLMTALNRDLGPDIRLDAEDPYGELLRPLTPPPGTARWAEDLPKLATVCRFIFEAEFGRSPRESEDANAARQYAARIARDVLERN